MFTSAGLQVQWLFEALFLDVFPPPPPPPPPYGAIQVLRNTIFLEIGPPPTPRNANNIEYYTFVTLFSRKSDTHPSALRNTWMAPIVSHTIQVPVSSTRSSPGPDVFADFLQNTKYYKLPVVIQHLLIRVKCRYEHCNVLWQLVNYEN